MFTVHILHTLDKEQGNYMQFSKNSIAIFLSQPKGKLFEGMT